jgi:pimeloyl-ACP methyl ester carboxylesterase
MDTVPLAAAASEGAGTLARMNIILVPGFWLDASSWSGVAPVLVEAGHDVRALTLPGLEAVDADRSGIGLRDHVDAVTAAIDAATDPVVLVGHSGAGAMIHAAADARPGRVARAIYVDSVPLGEGGFVTDDFPPVGDSVPLPDWDAFEPEDLVDLNDELRADFRARAVPEPYRVMTDRQELHDPRRYDVPSTVIACEFTTGQLRQWMDGGAPFVAELSRMHDVELVDLPTGHWPQFTRPAELGAAIAAAVGS